MPPGTTIGHVHLHVGDLAAASRLLPRGLGLDRVRVWSYPGRALPLGGGIPSSPGANTWAPAATAPAADQARLLEWTLVVPSAIEARAIGQRLQNTAAPIVEAGPDWLVTDPWGTRLRISPER